MATTILILESNPLNDLQLPREMRELKNVIESEARDRDFFDVKQGEAVRPKDLQKLMLRHEPQIVHFCGHGQGDEGLMLQDESGQPKTVDTAALSNLFELFDKQVKCVVLNACDTEVQAEAIIKHIDYAVGMRQAIGDEAARHFSIGFYQALGYGRSIEQAYRFGCNAIQLMLGSEKTKGVQRRDISRSPADLKGKALPEYLKPQLYVKGQGAITVLAPTQEQPSQEELETLSEALIEDDAQSQLREQIRQNLVKGQLTGRGQVRLAQVRDQLALSEIEVKEAINAEQEALREQKEAERAAEKRAQGKYSQLLKQLIGSGEYPFSEEVKEELENYRASLNLSKEVAEKHLQELVPASLSESLGQGTILEMVHIPGGTFSMGSLRECPQHQVTVPSFYMGKYPVTQAQWRVVAGLPKEEIKLNPDPSRFKGDSLPVEQVTWYEATEFCKRLSKKTSREYRLPSEAEWEYACRAGTTTRYSFGDKVMPQLANYSGNVEQTSTVGSYPANDWGLYDMHGNVWEWCQDVWHDNYEGAPTDGSPWLDAGSQEFCIQHGGAWNNNPRNCRSASRLRNEPINRFSNFGFRVVCVASRT